MASESASLLSKAQASHRAGDAKKAVYFMKVKKLKEAKVDELSGSLLNLETMVNTIEWTTQSKQVRVPVSAGRSGMCAFGVLKPDACRGS
jgi:hypothetical protein